MREKNTNETVRTVKERERERKPRPSEKSQCVDITKHVDFVFLANID